jgi:hypothetical protein
MSSPIVFCSIDESYSIKQVALNATVSDFLNKHPDRLISYGTLARECGGYCPDNKYLGKALGAVQQVDTLLGNPLRSARVVRKDKKKPGKGFWMVAKETGHEIVPGFWRSQCLQQGVQDFENIL